MFKTINSLFGVGPEALVEVREEASPFIPAKDDAYKFREDLVRAAMIWNSGIAGRNFLVHGPTGSGKSSLVEQFANRMGIPVYRVPCHSRSEFGEFTGQLTVKSDGSTEFVYGALPRAMREGAIILFDEFNFIPAGVTGALNTVLDGGPLLLPETGEIIQPHPNFRIAATGNGVDQGDDVASWRGTQRMNLALVQRFLSVKVDYLDPIDEAQALHVNAPGLPGTMIEDLIKTATDVRQAFVKGDLETTMGTRVLVKMCRILNARLTKVEEDALAEVKFSLGLTLTNGVKQSDARAIEGTLERIGIRFDKQQVRKATGSIPAAGAGTAKIQYYVNLKRANSGEASGWGFIEESKGPTIFSVGLTPSIALRWHGVKTPAEAKASADEKVAARGYAFVGEFVIPAGVTHSDYLEEVNAVARSICIAQRELSRGQVTNAVQNVGILSRATQYLMETYAASIGVKLNFV